MKFEIDGRRGAGSGDEPGECACAGPPFGALQRLLRGGGGRPLGERRRRELAAIVDAQGIDGLARRSAGELVAECGLSARDAERLAAAFDLGRAVERAKSRVAPQVARPDAVARLMAPELRGLEVETFHVLLLDARHRLKCRREISRGTLTSAPVHPREVFGPALRLAAAAVVVVHNHPSGDPEPSSADIDVTRRLDAAGALVGVPLLDHVVWARGAWVSLRERGFVTGS